MIAVTAAVLALLLDVRIGAGDPTRCACAEARSTNAWCARCKVGYVAGIEVRSWILFETLDAHGHAIDPARIRCESCQKALATDGFCGVCRMGFVHKQAYMSRLAYYLARGEIDLAAPSCADCRKNAAGAGWCEHCKRARVGRLVLRHREDLDGAREAVGLLEKALTHLGRCEVCAVACFSDGRCRTCKLSYRAGNAIIGGAR